MFDVDKCRRQDFASIFSLNAAIYAGNLCNRMLKMKAEGYTFFIDGDEFVPEFKFTYGEGFEISRKLSECAHEWIVGDTHSEVKGDWKVWCSKKELTAYFKRIKFVAPRQFQSLI